MEVVDSYTTPHGTQVLGKDVGLVYQWQDFGRAR